MIRDYVLTSGDKVIMQSFASALESAATKYRLDVVDFITKALTTEIFDNYLADYTIYSQSGSCIAGKILEEIERNGQSVQQVEEGMEPFLRVNGEIAYWIGYLLIYWVFAEGITGAELLNYDFKEIYWSYDVLHTQSIPYAIEFIKNEYRI